MLKKIGLLGAFVAHVLVGVLFFLILASAALLLAWFTHQVGTLEYGRPLVPILTVLEKAVLYGDCAFFLWWVIKSTIKALSLIHI